MGPSTVPRDRKRNANLKGAAADVRPGWGKGKKLRAKSRMRTFYNKKKKTEIIIRKDGTSVGEEGKKKANDIDIALGTSGDNGNEYSKGKTSLIAEQKGRTEGGRRATSGK